MGKPKILLLAEWFFDQFIYPLFAGLFGHDESPDNQDPPDVRATVPLDTTVPDGAVLDRIAYDPGAAHGGKGLAIQWPSDAPADVSAPRGKVSIPQTDVLVITWTAAEGRALADVLTPGTQTEAWTYYTTGYDSYLPLLTGRSPAKEAHRLGSWCQVTIGSKRVTCFKSELHPATDGPTLPTAKLVTQLIAECNPALVITTGTAGGAGDGTHLGDVNVAANVASLFTTRLKGHTWSKQAWPTFAVEAAMSLNLVKLHTITPATAALPSQWADVKNGPATWFGDTVSTDFFAFDTSDDHFGLRAYDQTIKAVEMDDAAVALGVALSGNQFCRFMSIRNASDPVMPAYSRQADALASSIYRRYGYWTTVNSAIACWAVISGFSQTG